VYGVTEKGSGQCERCTQRLLPYAASI